MPNSSDSYTTDTISVGKLFSIKLTEPICRNCDWHITQPSGVVLVDRKHETTNETTFILWTFSINKPGTYVLHFIYQKRCCGKPILKQVTHKIIAH